MHISNWLVMQNASHYYFVDCVKVPEGDAYLIYLLVVSVWVVWCRDVNVFLKEIFSLIDFPKFKNIAKLINKISLFAVSKRFSLNRGCFVANMNRYFYLLSKMCNEECPFTSYGHIDFHMFDWLCDNLIDIGGVCYFMAWE